MKEIKLLFCTECFETFNLDYSHKECTCGECGGMYLPQSDHAVYHGEALPLIIYPMVDLLCFPDSAFGKSLGPVFVATKEDPSFTKISYEAYLDMEEPSVNA